MRLVSTVRGRPGRGFPAGRTACWVLALAALPSCGEEGPRKVRLQITAEASIPEDIDMVRVVAAASRAPGGDTQLCLPASREFVLRNPGDLPITVDYVPGPLYDERVVFQVEWLRGGTAVNVRQFTTVPVAGATGPTAEARLYGVCLARPCAAGEQCVGPCTPPDACPAGASCEPLWDPNPLTDPCRIDGATPCDPAYPPPRDAGTPDAACDGG